MRFVAGMSRSARRQFAVILGRPVSFFQALRMARMTWRITRDGVRGLL